MAECVNVAAPQTLAVPLTGNIFAAVCIGGGAAGGCGATSTGVGGSFGGHGGSAGGMSLIFFSAGPSSIVATPGAGGAGLSYSAPPNATGPNGLPGVASTCEVLSAGGGIPGDGAGTNVAPPGGAGLQITGAEGSIRQNTSQDATGGSSQNAPSGGGGGTGFTGGGGQQNLPALTQGGLQALQNLQVSGVAPATQGNDGQDCLYLYGPGGGGSGGGCSTSDAVNPLPRGGNGGRFGAGGGGSGAFRNTVISPFTNNGGGAGGPGLVQIFTLG